MASYLTDLVNTNTEYTDLDYANGHGDIFDDHPTSTQREKTENPLMYNDTSTDNPPDIEHDITDLTQTQTTEKPKYDLSSEEYSTIDSKLLNLTKDSYIEKLLETTQNSEDTIIRYRNELLHRARTINGCPIGKMINRKTTNKSTLQLKTAKDCYILNAFINGDDTDINEVFTSSSKHKSNLNDSSICVTPSQTKANTDLNTEITLKILGDTVARLEKALKMKTKDDLIIGKKLNALEKENENLTTLIRRITDISEAKFAQYDAVIKQMKMTISAVGEFDNDLHETQREQLNTEYKSISQTVNTNRKNIQELKQKMYSYSDIVKTTQRVPPEITSNTNKSIGSDVPIPTKVNHIPACTMVNKSNNSIDNEKKADTENTKLVNDRNTNVTLKTSYRYMDHESKHKTDNDRHPKSDPKTCGTGTNTNTKSNKNVSEPSGIIGKHTAKATNIMNNLKRKLIELIKPEHINTDIHLSNKQTPEHENEHESSDFIQPRSRTVAYHVRNIDEELEEDEMVKQLKIGTVNVTKILMSGIGKNGMKSARIYVSKGDEFKVQNPQFWPYPMKCRQWKTDQEWYGSTARPRNTET